MNNTVLNDSIVHLGLLIRCQGYDGAQNFQGHVKGVAKRFNENNSAATSVHCLATLH